MVYVGDPVGIGFVKSLARPEGNIIELSTLADELGAKHFEMLPSMVPGLSRTITRVPIIDPSASNELDNFRGPSIFVFSHSLGH